MWDSFMYMIPVASTLAQARLPVDTPLRGDLQDELEKLVEMYVPYNAVRLVRNSEIDASINTVYKKGTNLLIVFNNVMDALGLSMEIKISEERVALIMLTLMPNRMEAQNGSFDLES